MESLQVREKEIFETLKKIKDLNFVLIGGYAVNAYTLPRFSVDCDIVVEEDDDLKLLMKEFEKLGYVAAEIKKVYLPFHGDFKRYDKVLGKNFSVSIDILFKHVYDRNSNALFSAEWVFENSAVRLLKGKTILEELKLKIINLDALIVMKFVSCRNTDMRDVFMLLPQTKNKAWIKEEVEKRCDFKERFERIKNKVTSANFKNDLQGVYGYVDEKIFEKHKKAVLEMENI